MSISKWQTCSKTIGEDVTGHLPMMVFPEDPRPAVDQINERYNAGGWMPFAGFEYVNGCLQFPGDPPLRPLAYLEMPATAVRSAQRVTLFQHSWVAVFQTDGTFEVSRMD